MQKKETNKFEFIKTTYVHDVPGDVYQWVIQKGKDIRDQNLTLVVRNGTDPNEKYK